jgi:hypothetical protein
MGTTDTLDGSIVPLHMALQRVLQLEALSSEEDRVWVPLAVCDPR